jgi:hypothetical protein
MDLLDSIMDVGSCLASSLTSIGWLVALTGSVWLKRHKLRSWLERHYKTTHVQRLQLRKRRLRDTLKDPVLVLDLERSMEKKYKGNRKRVLEAMEQLRQKAAAAQTEVPTGADGNEEEKDHDAQTKGDEKKQAANTIMFGTIATAVLAHAMLNIYGFQEWYTQALIIQYFFFFLVHIIDSFVIYHQVHKQKRFRFAKESVVVTSSYSSGDLEELLLTEEEQQEAA